MTRRTNHHPARRITRLAAAGLLMLFGLALATASPASSQQTPAIEPTTVLVSEVAETITPVVANHMRDVIRHAERDGVNAVVFQLDTPGGLESSMRDIVQRILVAEVPVIVHVSPQGARAASAGAIITFSAHVAAMAPGTAIGAATPVQLEGGDAGEKAINDSAAYARSVAELRGRNADFAEDTVRTARSVAAQQAVELNAVDLIAADLVELLEVLDGRTVTLASGQTVELRTAEALVDREDMSGFRQILQWLSDPNLVVIFMSVGVLGLIYELASPGFGIGGAIGATMLVLAMFSLAVLPVNVVGILFLLVAIGLFVAELFAPGVGVAAALGAFFLVLSGLFLLSDEGPGVAVDPLVIVPTAVVTAAAVIVAGRLALRTRKAPSVTTGSGLYVGRTVVVDSADGPRGQAHYDGAWWTLRSVTGVPLTAGQSVRVTAVDGIVLEVEPLEGGRPSKRRAGSDRTGNGAAMGGPSMQPGPRPEASPERLGS